ncbi:MAG: glucosamine-6-phosphate deaminase [Kiritimatiellaeota bacterium]|nr:glucosamine-6-phosphate deaminase [Kiritimatiellota bacterium]
MEVVIRDSREAAALFVAKTIADMVRRKPHIVLGLATGRTMEPVYAHLVRFHREDGLDFSLARTFNLDEYVNIPPEHPQSYRAFMDRTLFDLINIDRRNTRVLNGLAVDANAECAAFEQEIADCGGIDLQVLGIGRSGHIGFNEPTSSFASRTRIKTLTPETLRQNAPLFGGERNVPRHVLTMGVGTILESGRCLMLVTGAEKAEVTAAAIEGPLTSMVTASALQLHRRATFVLDREAATKLKQRDYYEWVYANKPHWERPA